MKHRSLDAVQNVNEAAKQASALPKNFIIVPCRCSPRQWFGERASYCTSGRKDDEVQRLDTVASHTVVCTYVYLAKILLMPARVMCHMLYVVVMTQPFIFLSSLLPNQYGTKQYMFCNLGMDGPCCVAHNSNRNNLLVCVEMVPRWPWTGPDREGTRGRKEPRRLVVKVGAEAERLIDRRDDRT